MKAMQKPVLPGTDKQPYEKPDVRKISLAAAEVAAAGCKTMSVMGPGGPACASMACMAMGS